MDAFIGSLILFGGNFAPSQWALAQGQLLAIASNSALFAILGTSYGGNGVQTFGLPNLASRVAVGAGQSPGLSAYVIGELGGTEANSILISNLPSHTHTAVAALTGTSTLNALGGVASTNIVAGPSAHFLCNQSVAGVGYAAAASGSSVQMGTGAVTTTIGGTITNSLTGSNIPVNNLQPFLAINYIVALFGIFPSRN